MPVKSFMATTATSLTITALTIVPAIAAPVPTLPSYQSPSMIQHVVGQEVTDKVVTILKTGEQACAQLPVEYRVDCLRQALRTTRSEIQRRPDYAAAAKEMNNAARALDKIVKANLDRAAPAIRVRGKKVRAVKKAAVPQVAAAARKVVTESATRLLRSGGSAERQTAHAQIARAIDSTKVILRT